MVHLQSCDNVLSPRSVTEYALLGCLLLTHSMSCIQIKDAVNYPLVMPDVRMHFVIRDSLMDTKIHAAINWQYFNNDEVAVDNVNNEVQSKTVIYSFEMILRESVMLLENKNLTITMNIKPVVRKIAMIAQAISASSSESQKVSQYAIHLFQAGGVKYLSREILLKQNMNMLHDFKATQDTAASTMTASMFQNNFDSCQSCQMREKAKRKSLESIKNQILMRLQLSRLPNITKPIAVPHIIIDKFYKNFNGVLVGNRRSATLRDVGWDTFSNTHLSAPRRIEKDVPFLPHHTEHAANFLTHPRQFPYGQQQYYQHLNNQPKYKTFHRPQNQQLHNSRVAIVKDNRDTLLELTDVEYHQHDDVQNDEHQQYRKQQQIYSKMQQQELTNYAKGHLLNTEENGRFYRASNDDTYTTHYEHIKDYDDESYSHVNSIYIFPTTTTRIRHNRRWEIINFKFDHNHFTIVRTIIHLYIRGREWIHEHYPDVLEQKTTDGKIRRRGDLIIMIHYVVPRSSSQNLTHTMKLVESRHRIPSGLGQWVQFEIKHMPPNWLNQNAVTISLAIKTQESWMRSFLVIDTENSQNKEFPLHIEAFIKQPRRQKRSTSLDCQESDHEVRCCRYPLKVNFTNFGWNFVIAPTSFDAYFCNGECKVGYLEQYTHTHIASLTTSATPCCSPTKMGPLSLLYFDQDHNLVLSTIPNMSVEKCSCS